jgi:lipid A 3-O-deacylase
MRVLLIAGILIVNVQLVSSQELLNAIAGLKEEQYVRFKYDNDFFNQTDRYYTQGIILDFIHPLVKRSPISRCLLRFKGADANYFGLHLQQDVFTAKSIRYMGGQIYYGERPFTAVFFLSHSLSSIISNKNIVLSSQVDIGFLGPLAKGKEEQKGIHKALDNIEPQGWDNQLSNAPVLNYRLTIEKGLLIKKHVAFSVFAGGRLGTLYTDATIGIKWQAGIFDCWFKNASANRFNLSVFNTLQSKLVVYNATLQGGLTKYGNIYSLPSSSIKRQVAQISFGLILVYKHLGLEYSRTFISPEFKGGETHGWGRCGITVRF